MRLMAQQSNVEKCFSDERLGWERQEKVEGGQEHGEKRTQKILDTVEEAEELSEAEPHGGEQGVAAVAGADLNPSPVKN